MGALQNLEKGNISGALHDIANWLEGGIADLESQFPIIGQFLQQFASDFGQKVLADAEALAPSVIAGTTTITAAAEQLVAQAGAQAASIASTDATNTALNALRLYVSAPATATAAPATTS